MVGETSSLERVDLQVVSDSSSWRLVRKKRRTPPEERDPKGPQRGKGDLLGLCRESGSVIKGLSTSYDTGSSVDRRLAPSGHVQGPRREFDAGEECSNPRLGTGPVTRYRSPRTSLPRILPPPGEGRRIDTHDCPVRPRPSPPVYLTPPRGGGRKGTKQKSRD